MAFTVPNSTILYEKKGQIAWITLNRPEAMNALSIELRATMPLVVEDAVNDDNIQVLILTSVGGKAFSAGQDLKERARIDATQGVGQGGGGPRQRAGIEVVDCPKATIAAVDGFCLAGGMRLALDCDIIVATEQSRFGLPEPRRSLIAAALIDTTERFIPPGEANLIQLTGGHMAAKRAYDIGLIQALLPDRDSMLKEAERIANEILLCAPLAVQATKAILKLQRDLPTPPEGKRPLEHLNDLIKEIRRKVNESEDRREGPKAFAEGRGARWRGR